MEFGHDSYVSEMMKLFRQFKLGQSLHRCKMTVDNLLFKRLHDNPEIAENVIVRHMVDELSSQILNQNRSALTKSPGQNFDSTEFEIKLLVVKPEDFRTIVEAAIQMLPEEKLKQIRNGQC